MFVHLPVKSLQFVRAIPIAVAVALFALPATAQADEPNPFFVEVHMTNPTEGATVPYGPIPLVFSVVPNDQSTENTCTIQDGQYPFDDPSQLGGNLYTFNNCDPDSPPTVPTLPAGKYTLIIQTSVPAHVNPGLIVKFSVAAPVETTLPPASTGGSAGTGKTATDGTGPAARTKSCSAASPGAIVEECRTQCVSLGRLFQERKIDGSDLNPGEVGFKGLGTRLQYALELKGTYHEEVFSGTPGLNGESQLRKYLFVPTRYALMGSSTATAKRHPKGALLGSKTTVAVDSTQTLTSYTVGLSLTKPPGLDASVTIQNQSHTANMTNEAMSPRSRTVDSMVLGPKNPVTGQMGTENKLKRLSVWSSVIPGVGHGGYTTLKRSSWPLRTSYVSTKPLTLEKATCKGIAWTN